MKIFISPDSFKGTLTSQEVAATLKEAWESYHQSITTLPFSDGGDGFLSTIEAVFPAKRHYVNTVDARYRKMLSYYLIHENRAYIESALAVGISQVAFHDRDILDSTAFGLGLLIKDAMKQGVNAIYLGLGGTATHELGLSVIQALGATCYHSNGILPIPLKAKDLSTLTHMDVSRLNIPLYLLTDVSSHLIGNHGAAKMFASQKGANKKTIDELEKQGKRWLALTHKPDVPGFAAAGGMAFGLSLMFDVTILSGADFLLHLPAFQHAIKEADLVVTGEGKLDKQTALGKAPYKIHAYATSLGKKTMGIFGTKDASVSSFFDFTYALTDHVSFEEAINHPKRSLEKLAHVIAKDMNFYV